MKTMFAPSIPTMRPCVSAGKLPTASVRITSSPWCRERPPVTDVRRVLARRTRKRAGGDAACRFRCLCSRVNISAPLGWTNRMISRGQPPCSKAAVSVLRQTTSTLMEPVPTTSLHAPIIPTTKMKRKLHAAHTIGSTGEAHELLFDCQYTANKPETVLTMNATSKIDQDHSQAFCVFAISSRVIDSKGVSAIVQSSCAVQGISDPVACSQVR
mmetsp:Transcript_14010/g.27076  ORF Transcript_14010/g.27076 Transcript_14010/m.27076 type:complete len:213 (-) Transcript_14010:222-860(-)